MAIVRIFLDPGETEEQAQDLLLKALTLGETGSAHNETFQQPAAQDVVNRMSHEYTKMTESMLREIYSVLEEDLL